MMPKNRKCRKSIMILFIVLYLIGEINGAALSGQADTGLSASDGEDHLNTFSWSDLYKFREHRFPIYSPNVDAASSISAAKQEPLDDPLDPVHLGHPEQLHKWNRFPTNLHITSPTDNPKGDEEKESGENKDAISDYAKIQDTLRKFEIPATPISLAEIQRIMDTNTKIIKDAEDTSDLINKIGHFDPSILVCRTEGNTQYVCHLGTYCCNDNTNCCTTKWSTSNNNPWKAIKLLYLLILGVVALCIKFCCKNSSDDQNTETTTQYEEVKETDNDSAKLNPERRFVLVPPHQL